MKRLKVIFVAAATFFAVGVSAQTADDVIEKYRKAAELVNAGKFAEAIPALKETIADGLDAGPEALENVQNAQKLLPSCLFRVALGYAKESSFDKAIVSAEECADCAELYGDEATMLKARTLISQLYSVMAGNAFNNKEYAKAAEIFAKGFEANPTDTKVAMNLAMSYCEMGDLDKGIDVYKKVIALGDTHSKYVDAAKEAKSKVSYYFLIEASAAATSKDYDKAVEIVTKSLAIVPDDAATNMLLVQSYTNTKNWDKLIEIGDAAMSVQVNADLKSDVAFFLGAAYQNNDNKAKAIETYRKVTSGGNVAKAKAQITALSK